MNGAEAFSRALLNSDVNVYFANPGTSEMQVLTALDRHPAVRGLLCLFEGVPTGSADGYARMTGRSAAKPGGTGAAWLKHPASSSPDVLPWIFTKSTGCRGHC
ncbi:thiamine pyrophosphate-binding protein [Streptomyces acidicola]|uniref:thiamine pyrophosphate-binding protein n=1 Tax=Streptomyces acidicola TaxID=2596892 RepID=UPI003421429F